LDLPRQQANSECGAFYGLTLSQDAPPEKLTIAFATADVTLTGWRLDRLADDLRDGDLLAVRALPARYANLDKTKCSVASITVEPVGKT